MTEEKKKEFKRKLAGEPVDWKEYAMWHIYLFCKAEEREKDADWESRYFYEQEKIMHEALGIDDQESEAIAQMYVNWLEKKGL